MIEYRICWTASSNARFEGKTDWEVWDDGVDDLVTEDYVLDDLNGEHDKIELPRGLVEAIEASGFEWWVETRVVAAASDKDQVSE